MIDRAGEPGQPTPRHRPQRLMGGAAVTRRRVGAWRGARPRVCAFVCARAPCDCESAGLCSESLREGVSGSWSASDRAAGRPRVRGGPRARPDGALAVHRLAPRPRDGSPSRASRSLRVRWPPLCCPPVSCPPRAVASLCCPPVPCPPRAVASPLLPSLCVRCPPLCCPPRAVAPSLLPSPCGGLPSPALSVRWALPSTLPLGFSLHLPHQPAPLRGARKVRACPKQPSPASPCSPVPAFPLLGVDRSSTICVSLPSSAST